MLRDCDISRISLLIFSITHHYLFFDLDLGHIYSDLDSDPITIFIT